MQTEDAELLRRVEGSELGALGQLEVDDLYAHIEVLDRQRPGPLDLYRRWEAQQWSASALDFTDDRTHWAALDPLAKDDFLSFFSGFFVGEQAVTDTLSPLVMGAPDEESRLFLSTQLVDEARHSFFFARFYKEALGFQGTYGELLDQARPWTVTQPFRQVFDVDLIEATEAVRLDPTGYPGWVRAVTLYHLLVEGVLALVGQRQLLQMLKLLGILPAFRSGFSAVTRDESRHVNFGVWALRQAVQSGHEGAIHQAIDRSLAPCLRVYANPAERLFVSPDLPAQLREQISFRKRWRFGIESLLKRLRSAGLNNEYLTQLHDRSWQVIDDAVNEYESLWNQEHPVRLFDRGEL